MKLELREFIESVRQMHTRSGVKRTRLMLKLRPFHTQKTFILKATDGQSTLTTRVSHQGQLKMVENMINTFVTTCTAASLQAAESANASGATHNTAASATTSSTSASPNASAKTAGGAQAGAKKGSGGNNNNAGNNNNNNAKGGAKKKGKK